MTARALAAPIVDALDQVLKSLQSGHRHKATRQVCQLRGALAGAPVPPAPVPAVAPSVVAILNDGLAVTRADRLTGGERRRMHNQFALARSLPDVAAALGLPLPVVEMEHHRYRARSTDAA